MKILVFAVVEESNRFLMIREASPKHAGKWYFPGGKIDAGETLVETVSRETREETGLEISVHGVIHVELLKGGEVHVYVSATFSGGSLKRTADRQSLNVAWKSLSEIETLELRDKTVLTITENYSNIEALPLNHFRLYLK